MIELEGKFEVLEREVKEINANEETLKKNLLDLVELQQILYKTQGFFDEVTELLFWYTHITKHPLAKLHFSYVRHELKG